MGKEYVFTVEVNGINVRWKCFVDENQVITYEGDAECERLTVTNPERKTGVTQLETQVRIFDEVLPFRLENGIPYIQLEGDWTLSDTTDEENLQSAIRSAKKQVYLVTGLGIFALIATIVLIVLNGTAGSYLPIVGLFCTLMGVIQYFRVKREVESLGHSFSWRL
jgi:hypothetical protein